MRACKADSDGTVLVSQAPTWRQALSCLTCVHFASSTGPPNMPRFEIDGDPIRVAYGYNLPRPGVFLSVYDKRLTYDPNASDL
jgi:hypothetical protein